MEARHNLYREVHKGMRSLLSDLTLKSGRVDFTSSEALEEFRCYVRGAFAMLSSHAEHENAHIAPALVEHAPEVAAVIGSAHDDQEELLDAILVALDEIDSSAPVAAAEGHRVVVRISRLVGELYTHMADEEEIVMPALWRTMSDEELLGVHHRLVGSIPPEQMAGFLRWMLPSMNAPERVAMLAGMQANAPAPAFQMVRNLAAEVLSYEDDLALERGLASALAVA